MLNGIENISQLPRFASANGWGYDAVAESPAVGAGLWERVSLGIVRDRVSGDGWETGRITGGTRQAQSVEQRGGWTITRSVRITSPESSIDLGYLAIRLPRRLPHMILDAKSNDRGPFSSLLNRPAADQALSLEGDFDSHFRLYVPSGYERDALYVFTPDLMALLIDESGDLDVEIRDDRLIVYKPGGFAFERVATWERFERIRQTVGEKAWSQTDMYLDERVAAAPGLRFAGPAQNDVGASGSRLRSRLPRMAWVGIGIALASLVFAAAIVWIVLSAVF
jgi:hypothetical protein